MVNVKETRQRGRPRTNTNEAESIARRRKQLRSAQQTYRKRKENAINTLRSRVHQLEDGIEQISHSFLAFSSLLLETDLMKRDSRVTLTLREIVQQCLALAKTGCDDHEERAHLEAAASTNKDVEKSSMQSAGRLDALEVSENTAALYESPLKQSETLLPNTQRSSSPVQSTLSFSTAIAPSTDHASTALSYSLYPLPSRLLTSTGNEYKGFSHFLIKVCCQSGYQLLVNTPNDMKVQEIFGTFLSPLEQDTFISYFCEGLQDHSGDLVDQMATVFAPMQTKRRNHTLEQLSRFYTASNAAAMTPLDDLMDASDVQAMLVERGFCISFSSSSLSSTFDGATFAQLLAIRCICFGYGPVFRRRNVETSLRLTTSDHSGVSKLFEKQQIQNQVP